MINALKSIGYRFQKSPLRLVLILLTAAIGVGVLGLALTVSFEISALVERTLPARGRLVSLTNGTIKADGSLDRSAAPSLSADDVKALASEYPALVHITPIAPAVGGNSIMVDATEYQARSLLGVGASYGPLLELQMAAGSFFSSADEDRRGRVAVISESSARILFGSAKDAMGRTLSTIGKMVMMRKVAGQAQPVQTASVVQDDYTVVGVFRDVDNVTRRAFGVGDILVPYTTLTPTEIGIPPMIMSLMARVRADQVAVARATVTGILQRAHGNDYDVALWEGNPDEPSSVIADARDSLTRFSLFLAGLGVLVLVVSSFGIFSIMLVEVVDRSREVGLRRAVGATRPGIVGLLAGQASLLALGGALIGAVLALLFHGPLLAALAPYLQTAGVGPGDLRPGLAQVFALLIAAASAVAAGGLFSILPAGIASRRPIVECLREE
jgi:putative ABC transport system permease protein